MKISRLESGLAVCLVFLALASVAVTARSEDRPSLKSGNGIEFSEFKGYDSWQVVAPSQPDDAGGCGSSPAPGCIKAIVGNPTMIKAYKDGIPANGKPVPDGAKMAKIEWKKSTNPSSPYAITVPGTLMEISFMVKDSKRFRDTNGWGYATFNYDAKTDKFGAATNDPLLAKNKCHKCHTEGARARDFVFTSYAKR